jgi:RimJ/RimL family protein N-acetyltransferase
MEPASRARLDAWWARVLGCPDGELWQRVTVLPHSTLAGFDGVFAAARGSGCHVSTPPWIAEEMRESLSRQGETELMSLSAYAQLAGSAPLRLIGPSMHAYTDEDPGRPPSVQSATLDELSDLRATVSTEEWEEAGFDDEVFEVFALRDDKGEIVAASNLADFLDLPIDVGLLVRPDRRGHGLGSVVGRAATSHAVAEHGIARWCARESNAASLRTAARLGFEPYCRQLAVRA